MKYISSVFCSLATVLLLVLPQSSADASDAHFEYLRNLQSYQMDMTVFQNSLLQIDAAKKDIDQLIDDYRQGRSLDANIARRGFLIYVDIGDKQLALSQMQFDIIALPPQQVSFFFDVDKQQIGVLRSELRAIEQKILHLDENRGSVSIIRILQDLNSLRVKINEAFVKTSTVFLTDYAARILALSHEKIYALEQEIQTASANGHNTADVENIFRELSQSLAFADEELQRAIDVFSLLTGTEDVFVPALQEGQEHLKSAKAHIQSVQSQYRLARIFLIVSAE